MVTTETMLRLATYPDEELLQKFKAFCSDRGVGTSKGFLIILNALLPESEGEEEQLIKLAGQMEKQIAAMKAITAGLKK